METKIKKNWYNRTKNSEELHEESKQWHSEIQFITTEIQFLEHLLSANYINCIEVGLYKKIEVFVNQLLEEKKIGKTLIGIINKHEKILSDLISTESVTSNKHFLDSYNKLEKELHNYTKNYSALKQHIFKIVETVMKKKSQKKLL